MAYITGNSYTWGHNTCCPPTPQVHSQSAVRTVSPSTRLPLAARFTGRLWPSILFSYHLYTYFGAIWLKMPEVLCDQKMGIRARSHYSLSDGNRTQDGQASIQIGVAEPFIVSDDAMKTACQWPLSWTFRFHAREQLLEPYRQSCNFRSQRCICLILITRFTDGSCAFADSVTYCTG